jgi:hypothetical protein
MAFGSASMAWSPAAAGRRERSKNSGPATEPATAARPSEGCSAGAMPPGGTLSCLQDPLASIPDAETASRIRGVCSRAQARGAASQTASWQHVSARCSLGEGSFSPGPTSHATRPVPQSWLARPASTSMWTASRGAGPRECVGRKSARRLPATDSDLVGARWRTTATSSRPRASPAVRPTIPRRL